MQINTQDWESLVYKLSHKFSKSIFSYPDLTIDDLQQEAWLALHKAAKTFDASKKVKFITYAYHCIYNSLCGLLRKQRMETVMPDDEIEQCMRQYSTKTTNHIKEIIEQFKYDENYKILQLYFYEGKTYKEIGAAYNVSSTTIGLRLKKILNKIKNKINHENTFYNTV